jgi:hypothetical protein
MTQSYEKQLGRSYQSDVPRPPPCLLKEVAKKFCLSVRSGVPHSPQAGEGGTPPQIEKPESPLPALYLPAAAELLALLRWPRGGAVVLVAEDDAALFQIIG